MVLTDNIGIEIPQKKGKAREFSAGIMKEQDSYLVSMEMGRGLFSEVCVKVGDLVKEGTLLGRPKDRMGSFVYSPVSGRVTAILQQMSISGNIVDHVLVVSDKQNEVELLPKLEDMSRKSLVERLMACGTVGEDGELCYIKYVRKPKVKKPVLIVSCVDNDPYVSASEVNLRENTEKVVMGALDFAKISEATKITFVFTQDQKSAISAFKKYVRSHNLKDFYIEVFPNLYPLTHLEIVRYMTGKNLDFDGRVNNGVFVENTFTCKEFFEAVHENKPVTKRIMTIGGSGFERKGNYVVKIGTSIEAIMNFVGAKTVKDDQQYKIVCGGVMTGTAAESDKVTINLSSNALLFLSGKEIVRSEESPCNYCGKCADVCPAKIMPFKIEEFLLSEDFDFAKYYGIEACTSCGVCSYVCPAKRYLAQRISVGKQKLKERGDI